MIQLDHIVVAAEHLEDGVAYVEDCLELGMPQAGGKHPLMGTHNRLMNLGGSYLEVIAADPEAPPPGRARWFDLDNFRGKPRLLTWVARVNPIAQFQDFGLGSVQKASRGNLEWLIAIPDDGRLHAGGAVPYLIEWGKSHPTDSLPPSGCSLLELRAFHPNPEAVVAELQRLGVNDLLIKPENSVRLEAHIQTPRGLKTLR